MPLAKRAAIARGGQTPNRQRVIHPSGNEARRRQRGSAGLAYQIGAGAGLTEYGRCRTPLFSAAVSRLSILWRARIGARRGGGWDAAGHAERSAKGGTARWRGVARRTPAREGAATGRRRSGRPGGPGAGRLGAGGTGLGRTGRGADGARRGRGEGWTGRGVDWPTGGARCMMNPAGIRRDVPRLAATRLRRPNITPGPARASRRGAAGQGRAPVCVVPALRRQRSDPAPLRGPASRYGTDRPARCGGREIVFTSG